MVSRSTAQSWHPDQNSAGRLRDDASSHQDVGHDHDEAASLRAKRLLARPSRIRLPFHEFGDWLNSIKDQIAGHRWVRQLLIGAFALSIVTMLGAGLLWWRLGEGPISLDFATPWLASAIEDNLGSDHSVEVGGTQIERAGRIRFAVRVLDIVVRDRDKAIVASAPKAEIRLSLLSLLIGRLRAESLNLVDAELSVQIQPDGRVIISTGNNARPIVSAKPEELALSAGGSAPVATGTTPATRSPGAGAGKSGLDGLVAALAWIDRLSQSGLNGYDLTEVGLKNGNLVVDDQQSGNKWTFGNITLGLRRLSGGGVSLRIGEEEPARPWSLRFSIGAAADGVRPVDLSADKVSIKDVMLALRLNDLPYTIDLPVSGRLRGEIGRDGLPTFFTGSLAVDAGTIVDRKVPDYPMAIDNAELNVDWDSTRRVLAAPFRLRAGGNRFTLLAHVEPPNDTVPNWQVGLSGGTILLAGEQNEAPLIFNRIAVRVRFDTDNRRIVLTQMDFSNGDIGVAGSGTLDYSTADPRVSGGIAGTPMPVSALKRMWPPLITPELREWVIDRIESGTLSHAEIAVNAPASTLARGGPPIPDDGLSVNILGTNARIRPVDELPDVHDADMRVRITGRTANVTIAQALVDTPGGRKLTLSDFAFDIPDLAPKPMPSRVRFRVDGNVPAVAEILNSDRLSEFSGLPIDPATSKGSVAAQVVLSMPLKNELTKADTTYSIAADLGNVAVDKLVMGQKLEAAGLKVLANNQGYQIKGDVKINGQPASLDYRKPQGDGDADIKLIATLDDASRARLGIDVGPGVTGAIGVKLNGKIGAPDHDTRLGIDADLSGARVENVIPGWFKQPGRSSHVTFNMTQKPQSTRFDDIVVDSAGTSIKGSVELDQNGELMNAAFPVYQPSEGDKATLKAERGSDGVLRIAVRGDVFDARGFIKAATSGSSSDSKSKQRNGDFDLDLKLGAVAGYNGEAIRNVDVKLSRRNGAIKGFSFNGKVGHDTPVVGDLRGRNIGHEVMYLETSDAGALFRFTDLYSKVYGGQMWIAMDPPTIDSAPQEGLIQVRDFYIRGETALQQIAANGQPVTQTLQNNTAFSRARAEFTRDTGDLAIRDGIVSGPAMGATIEGRIDYNTNQIRMSGTFLPAYALNNVFGQIPIVGLFLGGGSNEGLIGITYEVVGPTASPTLRVNPISAIAPGVLRKIFEFTTGRTPTAPTPFDNTPR